MKITMTNGTTYDSLDDLLRDHDHIVAYDDNNWSVDLDDPADVLRALSVSQAPAPRILLYVQDERGDAIGSIEA